MARVVNPNIWEGQFEPPTRNVLWKKTEIDSSGNVTLRMYKYNSGWQRMPLDQYSYITEPINSVTPEI